MYKIKFPTWGNPYKIRRKPIINLKSRKEFWKKFKFWTLRTGMFALGFILLLFVWYAKDLPTPGKIRHYQSAASTQIFDRNDKPIYAVHGDIQRIVIKSDEIPLTVKQATLTAEDRSFYRHLGIDVKGMARAAYNIIIRHKSLQSGSTITQQYVKNALLDTSQTFDRKIKEIILSLEIEVMYSKEDILTMYLNEIPYGSTAYGVESASQFFFNKKAKELNLAESATLAALPKAPTYYSPYGVHPDKRLARVNWILDSMADLKYISRDEANKAKEEAKDIKFAQPKEYIIAPHFAMYVKELLIEKYGEKLVESGGLRVTTTLDLDKQKFAEEAVKNASEKRFDNIGASNAALVSIDPKTGQIIAMIGSADFFNNSIDGQVNVADALRQPGSSFKPIAYATAFEGKYNPAYTLWDVTTDFGGGYIPKNYDGNINGPVSMRQALAGSLNIPAVKTIFLAGLEKTINTAHNMGITTLNGKAENYGLPLVLGSGEVKLVDLTTAYGVFANSGKLSSTTAILKVTDNKGKILEEFKEESPKQVLKPEVAYQISSILSDNEARSFVFGSRSALNIPDREVAVKTGTTSDYRDAWTIGYTPSLVTGVWVGNNNNKKMAAGSAGAMAAAPIWQEYMIKALRDTTKDSFIRPGTIKDITVDRLSNKLPGQYSPETITDIFAPWQAPKDQDDIHVAIRVDKFTGKRATDNCPNAFVENKIFTNLHSEVPSFANWENPVISYAQEKGFNISYPPSETSCSGQNSKPTVEITSPKNNAGVAASFNLELKAYSAAGIKNISISVDNKVVTTLNKEPFSATIENLSKGKHKISASMIDNTGVGATSSINVIVSGDKTSAGQVKNVSVKPTNGALNVYWINPSDSDLKSIRIYGSTSEGSLGNVLTTISAIPSTNGSAKLSGLLAQTDYWLTLRPIDSSGNETQDSTQYKGTTL